MNFPSFNYLQPESIFVELDSNFIANELVEYDYTSYRNTSITGRVTIFSNVSSSSVISLILPDHLVSQQAMFKHMHN
jgi:hypothetical protein